MNLPPVEHIKCANMILIEVILRPTQPSDIDRFLRPLIDEFKLLSNGIEGVVDGSANETFTIRGHIGLVTGDLLPVGKLTTTMAILARSHCRVCQIKGYYCHWHRHRYCPTTLLTEYQQGQQLGSHALREGHRIYVGGRLAPTINNEDDSLDPNHEPY